MAFDRSMQFGSSMRWLLLAALVAAGAGAVRADVVHLRNGNTIEGIITQETAQQIVLELGTGSTSLSRNSIATIDHASEDENSRLQADWKHKYFLHKEYVPADLAGLAAEFAKLSVLREEALRASRSLSELTARDARLQAELEQLHEQIVQVGHQIQNLPTKHSAEAYNSLIASNNMLQVRGTIANGDLNSCHKERVAADEHISAYLEAVATFGALFAEERKKQPENETSDTNRSQFFNRLKQALADFARDFSAVAVSATPSNAGVIVAVTVNDLVTGRFLVDTGAARVTVTERFAQQLQIDLSKLPETEFTMADGHKTTGRTLVFHSMAVGSARAEKVEAAVLPGKPCEQVDGLLGMSFLRHFAVNLDGNNGKLILRQFAPK